MTTKLFKTEKEAREQAEILGLIPFGYFAAIPGSLLADRTRLTEHTVRRVLKKLVENGTIQKVIIKSPRLKPTAHYYRLVAPPTALHEAITTPEPNYDFLLDLDPNIIFGTD